jgi:hypothetical protein
VTILEQLQRRKAELEPQVANLLKLSDELQRVTSAIQALSRPTWGDVIAKPPIGDKIYRPLESGRYG